MTSWLNTEYHLRKHIKPFLTSVRLRETRNSRIVINSLGIPVVEERSRSYSTKTRQGGPYYYRMASMKIKRTKYTEAEKDEIAVREADVDSAWGKPTRVKAMTIIPVILSPRLLEKAQGIAKRRKMKNAQAWMQRIIRERIERELKAF
jgi:hypothetical protein